MATANLTVTVDTSPAIELGTRVQVAILDTLTTARATGQPVDDEALAGLTASAVIAELLRVVPKTPAEDEAEEYKNNYLGACKTIADMHAAAVGGVTGPTRGVVEDVADVRDAMLRAEQERDGAYRERAQLVAHLASIYPSHIGYTDRSAPDWAVVIVQTPTGQMSWHVAPSDMDLFEHVPRSRPGGPGWDGHTTEQKYKRLRALTLRKKR
ncbi:WDGH domain-containing protein [Streptomyces wuyuanensis]|uniref:WDGH domain-containing protein n=1 Tax=Streptomyces wuyuanensis TaxID=1196353 RepID=A0A1G9VY11_9ACTN|nr:hypothetical protein [Streptomyces wuyuanensis]SDM76817.1 hypothetical protein SAMN05444921_11332 [Streptomyces wuyuanensis]